VGWHDVRRVRAGLAWLAALGLLTACSSAAGTHASDGDSAAAPSIAEVTPLADAKAWQGEVHASLPDVAISPVTEDPVQSLPVTVTDAQGTEVTVTDTRRILALDVYGTLSQTVFELGLGDHVVGRDLSTQFPEARDLPLVTQERSHDLVAERMLEVDPTVIITDTSLGPWDAVLQMRDAGIPVVVVDSARSLDNLKGLTMEVATALGVPAAGEQLGDRIEADARTAAAQVAAVAPAALEDKLRMMFLYVRGQANVYYLFGEGSGADGLIDALGGYDVAAEIDWQGMKPLTAEAIVAAQPDLVLMMTKGLESVGGVDGLLDKVPALANTPAGENRRVVDMTDTGILSYGPRTAEVLNSLGVAIYAPESAS
jgi:iron complex transport system substrate-binding protein